jgi:hypothetical protein
LRKLPPYGGVDEKSKARAVEDQFLDAEDVEPKNSSRLMA